MQVDGHAPRPAGAPTRVGGGVGLPRDVAAAPEDTFSGVGEGAPPRRPEWPESTGVAGSSAAGAKRKVPTFQGPAAVLLPIIATDCARKGRTRWRRRAPSSRPTISTPRTSTRSNGTRWTIGPNSNRSSNRNGTATAGTDSGRSCREPRSSNASTRRPRPSTRCGASSTRPTGTRASATGFGGRTSTGTRTYYSSMRGTGTATYWTSVRRATGYSCNGWRTNGRYRTCGRYSGSKSRFSHGTGWNSGVSSCRNFPRWGLPRRLDIALKQPPAARRPPEEGVVADRVTVAGVKRPGEPPVPTEMALQGHARPMDIHDQRIVLAPESVRPVTRRP